MDNILGAFIEKIRCVVTEKEYDEVVQQLNQTLYEEGYSEEICQEIKYKQKYIKNRFSDEMNREKMLTAKENLLDYLYMISRREKKDNEIGHLEKYLKNFYMLLEALTEREPDRRATLTKDKLQHIKIGNEYDLQHLLYAVLKPAYPDIRKEVAEDSGVGMVRYDLKIPGLNLVLETKCTGEKTRLKKLTEEIEADIVHYSEDYILFYIYDKEKIIKDKQNYESQFNRVFDGKNIKIIIQQPISI